MGVKKFCVSNGCKNILGVKWVSKYFRCQMGVKILYVSNGCKNILGVKLA